MDAIKVLIVDDEERFRLNLRKLLTAEGLMADVAASGEEALAWLEKNPVDVVLLDVRMPGMSGVEALAEIKKRQPEVEVLILTGHACVDSAVEIMRLGGADYLLKPCPIEEILDKIGAAYERKRHRG